MEFVYINIIIIYLIDQCGDLVVKMFAYHSEDWEFNSR